MLIVIGLGFLFIYIYKKILLGIVYGWGLY